MPKEQCKKSVWGEWHSSRQCSRAAVEDGLCRQHHPDSVEKRKIESQAKYEKKQKSRCRRESFSYIRLYANKEDLNDLTNMIKDKLTKLGE